MEKGWCQREMLNYIQYLNMPSKVALALVGIFFILQIIGELLEFKGKAVPEIIKIRKIFARKKREREILAKLPDLMANFEQAVETLKGAEKLFNEVNLHYSADNITKRNKWMKWVDEKATEYDNYGTCLAELEAKMDKNTIITTNLFIEQKRDTILSFASKVIDENYPVTREQFKRIFKIHKEYEEIIEQNNITNGEVDIAFRIITEAYEKHMKNRTFIEDIRGY